MKMAADKIIPLALALGALALYLSVINEAKAASCGCHQPAEYRPL